MEGINIDIKFMFIGWKKLKNVYVNNIFWNNLFFLLMLFFLFFRI